MEHSIQDSDIKIYDVDNGWKVKKNIRARSLRWTITDTSLSPDQRFLVSYCKQYMKCISRGIVLVFQFNSQCF